MILTSNMIYPVISEDPTLHYTTCRSRAYAYLTCSVHAWNYVQKNRLLHFSCTVICCPTALFKFSHPKTARSGLIESHKSVLLPAYCSDVSERSIILSDIVFQAQ